MMLIKVKSSPVWGYEFSIIRWKEDEAGNKRSAVVAYYFGQVEGQFALLHIITAG
ncbi:hypothetical protein [Saprospira grandis]|uniref:hypothetical protein n=1 Tax=Saprospira grandis TaxID=1008 RepID=UPI0012DD6B1C|nr:hypothetical protein [Saprospira grandis]